MTRALAFPLVVCLLASVTGCHEAAMAAGGPSAVTPPGLIPSTDAVCHVENVPGVSVEANHHTAYVTYEGDALAFDAAFEVLDGSGWRDAGTSAAQGRELTWTPTKGHGRYRVRVWGLAGCGAGPASEWAEFVFGGVGYSGPPPAPPTPHAPEHKPAPPAAPLCADFLDVVFRADRIETVTRTLRLDAGRYAVTLETRDAGHAAADQGQTGERVRLIVNGAVIGVSEDIPDGVTSQVTYLTLTTTGASSVSLKHNGGSGPQSVHGAIACFTKEG